MMDTQMSAGSRQLCGPEQQAKSQEQENPILRAQGTSKHVLLASEESLETLTSPSTFCQQGRKTS